MAMNAIINEVADGYSSRTKPISPVDSAVSREKQVKIDRSKQSVRAAETEQPLLNIEFNGDSEAQDTLKRLVGKEKDPAKSTIDATMSSLNARMKKTKCAYAYDEETKRITIKVYDSDSDELIREVPPEKSLEALKKVWELAGIIIDQKG